MRDEVRDGVIRVEKEKIKDEVERSKMRFHDFLTDDAAEKNGTEVVYVKNHLV